METPRAHRNYLKKTLKWTALSVGGLLALAVILLCAATWWLTPERLTRIVNEKASEELNADVRASDIRFTIWSTFPHLDIEMDSLHVRSRNFDSLPAVLRQQLPANADFLLSTSHLHGGINLLKLLAGKIWLRNVQVDSLRVNLVALTDSINNYDITQSQSSGSVPVFYIDDLRITQGGNIRYQSVPSKSLAEVSLKKASLTPTGKKNAYTLALGGDVTAISDGLVILNKFPIGLDGDVAVRFKPFGIATRDYRVSLGSIDGKMAMDLNLGNDAKVNIFNYSLQDFTLSDLYEMLPEGSLPQLRKITANVALDCSARLTSPYNFSSTFLPSLQVDFRVPQGEIDYSLSDDKRYAIKNVRLNGSLVFDGRHPEDSYVEIPEFTLVGCGASLEAEGRVDHLTQNPAIKAHVNGKIDLAHAAAIIDELRPYGPAGTLSFGTDLDCYISDNTLVAKPISLKINTPQLSAKSGSARITLNNLDADIEGRLRPDAKGNVLQNFNIRINGGKTIFKDATESITLKDTKIKLNAGRLPKALITPDYVAPAAWSKDARTLGFAKHSPELIHVNISDKLRRIMGNWGVRLDADVASVDIRTSGYNQTTSIKGINLKASFDSIALRAASVSSGRSEGNVSANISNLRQFLASHTPAPITVALNLDLDTIQCNQLARAYAAAHPEQLSDDKSGVSENTASIDADSMAYIIPRNLRANIHASAAQTRYINLHLYDLETDISVSDGNASVERLHIAADFGNADMSLRCYTANLQEMCLDAKLGINDVNVVNFFKNFHSLLEMMPQMKNLSGMLSADISGRVRIFPNMNLMVPSLWADARLEGWDLVIHQNAFIRHITDMLLIPNNDDLQIADMKIHAGIHSNLLEVFPFMFEVEKYKLCMGGLNNFNGDLYYHIGVEDWPLKFPFGINVKGTYSHPVLKFGGKAWHDSNGAKIAGGIQDYDRVNVVHEARKYTKKLVNTAATYTGD